VSRSQLIDVVAWERDRPGSYDVPPFEERATLVPGDLAQLVFDGVEKVWVKVSRASHAPGGTYYSGNVVGEPLCVTLKTGDRVDFRPRHVVGVSRRGRTF
jgi:hypothetical protein